MSDDAPTHPREEEAGMSFGDHLDALRRALILSIAPPVVLVFVIWPVWEYVHRFVSNGLLDDDVEKLARLTALDTFSLSIRIAVSLAVLITAPWIIAQIWMFIKPGLYKHERRFGLVAIPLSMLLFAGGVAFGFFIVLPNALGFLLDFGSDAVAHNFLGIEYFYKIVFAMLLILGLTFQLPLIMASSVRFGILTPRVFAKRRRIVIFISAVLGAFLTPTGDPISMMLVATPIYLLAEGGVALGSAWKARADRRAALAPKTIEEGFREGLGENSGSDEDEGDFAERFAAGVSKMAKDFAGNVEEGAREFKDSSGLGQDDEDESDDNDDDASGDPVPLEPAPTPPVDGGTQARDIVEEEEAPRESAQEVESSQADKPDEPQAPSPRPTPVPKLPKELRRRIDAYIRERLDEILDEVQDENNDQDDERQKDDDSGK